ncbi:hypothetical protein DFH07DRAFT_939951 [Mycena maculata]|uniref:Myb-like domain-containing protein n=1 Tax=Mycena maculata TaxID=230809 RepID=A0AAD7JAK8_9AGAR|nr:hypothetical protein DFH07DRAFT_939951 [Mycena maculata]
MDNPQHYQPLSYALHPPNTSSTPKPGGMAAPPNPQREEVEEEEDENLVADDLNQNDHASDSSTSRPRGTGEAPQEHQFLQEPDPGGKRRPGRPRGSKNRKIQSTSGPADAAVAAHPTGTGSTPPQLPEVNPQNQQYYEFQWRVLNLCAEFYGAAEELMKGTPPLVVAQCYQMGPGSKVDPLIMLSDAKRICDTLLANPSQLISTPPPPLYPSVPTFYHPQPVSSTSASAKASTSAPKPQPAPPPAPAPPPPSTVITNPQSFVVSLGTQPTYSAYPGYAPAGQYHPGPYYAPYPYTPGYYPPPQPQPPQSQSQPPPQPQAGAKPQPPPPQASTSTLKSPPAAPAGSGNGANQGPWSDEEVERLKKLAEDSKARAASGEIEWDWVVSEWGPGRTRHQILLKATGIGLKESSGRGNKRRRETDEPGTPISPAPPPNPAAANSKMTMAASTPSNTTGSPAMSHSTSTPIASPAMHNLQHPAGAKGHAPPPKPAPTPATSGLPWPMPTVAAANVSPVLTPTVQGDQRTSYYRPRPAQADASGARSTTHQFMYQNNPPS